MAHTSVEVALFKPSVGLSGVVCLNAIVFPADSIRIMTDYLYNAEGIRVAKGSGSFSCNLSANGFTVTHWYILDLAGRQMTEYGGSGNWLHSNVFANGELLATYSSTGTPLSFALNDWLATKRVQAKADGELDLSFLSLPYGDQLATGTGATEQFFTGKERDSESGNDYFGARYYSNAFGRWLSPDWSAKEEPIPYAKLNDPQSLNLYDYLGDNPKSGFDADGHAPGGMTGDEECALGAVSECVPKPSQQPSQAQQQSGNQQQTGTAQGYWVYDQKTGELSHVSSNGKSSEVGTGYSGHGKGVNNPAAQDQPGVGPIPQGKWHIGLQKLNVTGAGVRLPGSMRLTPLPGTNTFGRAGFLMHGDNRFHNDSASEGCVIMAPAVRNQVGESPDRTLVVIP